MTLFGHVISWPQLYGQLLIGLINGSFYALLSLGLAVIFGMLTIVNFAHGAFYMMGAFGAYFLLKIAGLDYWWALILSPILIGAVGAVVERLFLKRLAGFDPLYSLLLTFGLALIIQGLFQNYFGASGMPYAIPKPAQRGLQSRLHVPARLPRLGHRRLDGRLLRRPGSSSRRRSSAPISGRGRRTRPWCAPSASTCRAW